MHSTSEVQCYVIHYFEMLGVNFFTTGISHGALSQGIVRLFSRGGGGAGPDLASGGRGPE